MKHCIRRKLDGKVDEFIKSIASIEAIDNLKDNPKKFWSFIAVKKKDVCGIPILK